MKRFKEYVKSKFNRLADWVTKHAPPMQKNSRRRVEFREKQRSAVTK